MDTQSNLVSVTRRVYTRFPPETELGALPSAAFPLLDEWLHFVRDDGVTAEDSMREEYLWEGTLGDWITNETSLAIGDATRIRA